MVADIVRIGHVTVSQKDPVAVDRYFATIWHDPATHDLLKIWSKIKIVVPFNINNFCA